VERRHWRMTPRFGQSTALHVLDISKGGNMSRKVNEAGLGLIKSFEKCVLHPYDDGAGYMTIGWGHLIKKGEKFTRITRAEADAILVNDLSIAESAVERNVKVALNDNQFAALVSFTFNVGEGGLKRSSLLRLLNRGNYDAVPEALKVWNKANGKVLKGLVRRRAAEGRLWERPIPQAPAPPPLAVAAVEPAAPPATPVEGGGKDDVATTANKQSLISKILKWAGGATGITAAVGTGSTAVASIAGIDRTAQLILVVFFCALIGLAIIVFGVMAVWLAAKDHAQTKAIAADPNLQNKK
jgi:lysozyme